MSDTIKLGGALDRDPMALLVFIMMAGVLLLILGTNNPLNPIYVNAPGCTPGQDCPPSSSFNDAVGILFIGSSQTGGVGLWMILLPTALFMFLRIWMRDEGAVGVNE